MKFITPIILIGISVAVFFTFVNPFFQSIQGLRAQSSSFDEALNNSKALENERDKLTAKYNSINPENLIRLEKLLPENVDNIRLILEIEELALPYGMVLRDIKYNTKENKNTPVAMQNDFAQGVVAMAPETLRKDYDSWDLEFSTIGSYSNFMNFTKDLEKNLRIVEIVSIDFSSDGGGNSAPGSVISDAYKYDFKIKTYWLKN